MSKRLKIVTDFKSGLTTVGLARKYCMTKLQIEAVIRDFMMGKYVEGS